MNLLLLKFRCAALTAPAEAYPWEIFAAALSASATATIESSADESDTDLATAVFRVKFPHVQDISSRSQITS